MYQQRLLLELAKKYDFSRANLTLSQAHIRPFARAWMAVDLSMPLADTSRGEVSGFGLPYQQSDKFYKYVSRSQTVFECEKRLASKADLVVNIGQQSHFWEFHYLHQQQLNDAKALQKLKMDIERVRTLRSVFTPQQVTLLVGLWGSFSPNDCKALAFIDNNQYAAYALDSLLQGSSQVSRLMQIEKQGQPRLRLIAI